MVFQKVSLVSGGDKKGGVFCYPSIGLYSDTEFSVCIYCIDSEAAV